MLKLKGVDKKPSF